jgi:hypothetical protein
VEFLRQSIISGCPRTGIKFKKLLQANSDYSNRDPWSPSVDKIDPTKGYTKDNVQIVSWWYNVSKQQFTDDEVLEFCQKVISCATKIAPTVEVRTD